MTIKPVAFLCVQKNGEIKLVNMETGNSTVEKVAEAVPSVVDKLVNTFKKDKKEVKKVKTTEELILDDPDL